MLIVYIRQMIQSRMKRYNIHTGIRAAVLAFAVFMAMMESAAVARNYKPEEIENPNIANRYEYIADPEHLVSPVTRGKVNDRLMALRDSTTAEVAVAVVPSIGDYSIEDFSEKVFTRWGLGKSDKDNGVLLLISPESRKARIQTGYGAEGVLPDITCAHIINSAIVPNMQDDCLDCAIDAATSMIAKIMEDPTYAEELKSKLAENHSGEIETPVSKEDIITFCIAVGCAFWMIALIAYIYQRRKTRRLPTAAEKAHAWHSELVGFGALAVLTCLGRSRFIFSHYIITVARATARITAPTAGARPLA